MDNLQKRYVYFIDEYDDSEWCIYDNINNYDYVYLDEITNLLNFQDDRIKFLEKKLDDYEKSINSI